MTNQKGFISLGILLAIILGVVVIGGGAYYVMQQKMQPQVSMYQADTAAPTTQATTNTPAKTTTQPASQSTAKTYSNSQYGFSIQYPTTLTETGYASDASWYDSNSQPTGTTLFSRKLALPPDTGNGAVVSGNFTIEVSNNSADTASCLVAPPSSETATSHVGTTAINGVSFLSYERDDAFAGGSSTTNHYRTVHNGSCFDIYATITYAGGAAGAQDAAANQAQLKSTFNAMVQSFKFTTQ